MEPLRILLVGFGVRGGQWRRVVDGRADIEVAGIVEPAPADVAGIPVWSTLGSALDVGGFDAALICSPPERHPDDAIACMEAGLDVMIEKPLALSYVAAARVSETADRAGRVALVGQNFRFRPHETLAREILSDGGVGPLRSVDVVSRRPRSTQPPRPTHPVLWDYAIHHLDLLRSRFGLEVQRIVRARVDPVSVEVEFEFEHGARVRYDHEDRSRRFRYRERIRGDRGSIVLSEAGVRGPGRMRRRADGPPGEDGLIDELRSARSGNASAVSVADNLQTIALVVAVERSSIEGRPVRPSEVMEDPGAAVAAGGTDV